MKPNNNKLSRIKKLSVESPVSSAKKSKRSTKRKPATPNSPRATAAQPPDLSAQVAELQEQIAAIRKAIEQPQSSPSPVSAFRSQPSASSLDTSHSPLNHAVVAQREGGPPPSPLDSGPSTLPAAKPLPIYELKETRPVGHQSLDLLASSSEESQDGFFTGLLDRARIQWLMGDWEGLGTIRFEAIKGHPDKAKLALLAAAGCLQTGKFIEGKIFMRMALDWGANRRMAAMFLVSGAHHSIGKAATVAKDTRRGALHFERAKTAIDFPGNSNKQKHISYRAQFSQG